MDKFLLLTRINRVLCAPCFGKQDIVKDMIAFFLGAGSGLVGLPMNEIDYGVYYNDRIWELEKSSPIPKFLIDKENS